MCVIQLEYDAVYWANAAKKHILDVCKVPKEFSQHTFGELFQPESAAAAAANDVLLDLLLGSVGEVVNIVRLTSEASIRFDKSPIIMFVIVNYLSKGGNTTHFISKLKKLGRY